MIQFSAPAVTTSLNWRVPWGARNALEKRVHTAIQGATRDIPAPNYAKTYICMVRVGPRTLDDDNLTGALKPVRDSIARWLGIDDGSSRLDFKCRQRKELVEDPAPRAKKKFLSWVEISVSDEPSMPDPHASPAQLERERKTPPVLESASSSTLASEVPVGSRGLKLGKMFSEKGEYIRICTHFAHAGHMWRTQGIRVELQEVDILIEALKKMR